MPEPGAVRTNRSGADNDLTNNKYDD